MEPGQESQITNLRRAFVQRLAKIDIDAIRARIGRERADEEHPDGEQADRRAENTRGWQQLTLGPAAWADPDTVIDPDEVLLVTALSTFVMAQHITAHANDKSQATMQRVVDKRQSEISALTNESGIGDLEASDLIVELIDSWPETMRLTLLIDLQFTDPFFPYDIKVQQKDFDEALRWISRHVGVGANSIDEIFETRRAAETAHTRNRVLKVTAFGAGGLILFAAGGWALAPLIGTAVGTGAGLYGAAATSYGLATLGGGAVAAGGAGMAGGMFLVTGASAAVGAVGSGGAAFLIGVGSKQARLELVRLQVTYKMTILQKEMNSAKAAKVVENMQAEIEKVEAALEEERLLNDRNSYRLKEFEKKLSDMRNASEWMQAQADRGDAA